MAHDDDAAESSRLHSGVLDQTDRILLAGCAALWLVALGAAVAAIVALVGLGADNVGTTTESDTPWLLYTVIAVSGVVIAAAVPLLIRARRASLNGTGAQPDSTRRDESGSVFGDPVSAPNLRASGAPVIRRQPVPPTSSRLGFPTAAVEQIWLRCPVVIIGGVGAATAAVSVATYLSATEHDVSAWVAYGLAGVIMVTLVAAPVFFLRQLRTVLA